MLKSVLSAAAIFVLLFAICFMPASVSARRCPEKMPETLLSLYKNSDAIYIARFDKIEDGEIGEQTPDYTAVSIKKYFSISSTLKGESRKFFVLDEVDYRYQNTGEVSEESEVTEKAEAYEDSEEIISLNPGDSLLLFLKNSEGEESPTLTDYRDGTKKLSTADIGVYESRIKELNSIFSAEKVDEVQIVRWLIRCAEDPATRWEGTFELLQSVQNLEWMEKSTEERKAKIARGEATEPEKTSETEEDRVFETGNPTFAKLLDVNQKQTLSNLLLNRASSPSPDIEDKTPIIRGDRELLELVQRWGDSRLPSYLLDQLRARSEEPYAVADLMNSIAGILNDARISELANRYGEISYEDAAAEVSEENQPDKEVAADAVTEENSVNGDDVEPEETKAAEVPVSTEDKGADGETVTPKKITYKELRQNILSEFLQRSERVLAKKQQAKDLAAVH